MRSVRGPDHRDVPYGGREALREGERHHAAIGCADDGREAVDAEVPAQRFEQLRLVEGRDRGKVALPRLRTRTAPAAAEPVDAEHTHPVRVDRETGTDDLVPPACPAVRVPVDIPAGRDPAQRDDDGQVLVPVQAPGHGHLDDFATVMQTQRRTRHQKTIRRGHAAPRRRLAAGDGIGVSCGLGHRALRQCRFRIRRFPAEHPRRGGSGASSPARNAAGHAATHLSPTARNAAFAGLGTFTDWLGPAVAPASWGLIPRPVRMSGGILSPHAAQGQGGGPCALHGLVLVY